MKMEVDSWVSVQARREQFEQQVSPQKTPSFHPTPRPRTLSIPNNTSPNCDELKAYQGKNTQSFYREFNCGKDSKHPSKSKNASDTFNNSGPLPRNNVLMRMQLKSPGPQTEESSQNVATPKSSPPKAIPAFRTKSIPIEKASVDEEKAGTPADTSQGIRGRLFSHIRSRSHGNFIVKRDQSEERTPSCDQKTGAALHKENRFHKDWLTPKRKQRSIDNLLNNDDSSSSSSFEGKQKLVSNVVNNMKNKETPTVLRKLSFSSKNEKDIKNLKEKSIAKNKGNKQSALLTSLTGKTGIGNISNKQKSNGYNSGVNINHKQVLEEKPPSHMSRPSFKTRIPEFIAMAVAEAVSKRESTPNTEMVTPSSSDDRLFDPPERPPRRRTPCPGHSPRRKGKAPIPPCPSTKEENEIGNNNSECSDRLSSLEESTKTVWCRLRDSSSLDNLESPSSSSSNYLVARSCENLSDTVHTSSSPGRYYTNVESERLPQEYTHNSDVINRESLNKDNRGSGNTNEVTDSKGIDETLNQRKATEVEGLPCGPPPKKPPRTFAYDIYKSISTPTPDKKEKKESPAVKNNQPIYAVPLKKSNKNIAKPPVRSKSDLSKEIAKPSVAPKPPHVLAKAKRASLVDPLTSPEKEEEAAITSEFQRQAHVRYSLRRPNEPPPPKPPSQQDDEGNYSSDSKLREGVSPSYHHDRDYSSISYEKEHDNPNTQRNNIYMHGSLEQRSPCSSDAYQSDHEDVTPRFVSSSCQGGKSILQSEHQPQSLTYCFANTPTSELTYAHTKRSMSDETLYKGSKPGEPVYATPTFKTNNLQTGGTNQELHYMCSILFTDDEEADAGRDMGEGRLRSNSIHGREKGLGTETEDGNKGRSSLISAWKREFRQSCRQVQSRIKKTVAR